MGKTKRNASRWMESRFKLGDTQYPEENETHYFNGRYQNKMRNGTHSYHSNKIDPRTYKVSSWREYGRDIKVMTKRAARRNAKILVRLETLIIMDELWKDLMEMIREYDNWYYEDYEAYDYAERRRLEELEDEKDQRVWWSTYDPYEDWDY